MNNMSSIILFSGLLQISALPMLIYDFNKTFNTPFQFSFWTLLKNEQNDNLFFLAKHLEWYLLFI